MITSRSAETETTSTSEFDTKTSPDEKHSFLAEALSSNPPKMTDNLGLPYPKATEKQKFLTTTDYCKLFHGPIGVTQIKGLSDTQDQSFTAAPHVTVKNFISLSLNSQKYALYTSLDRLQREHFSKKKKSGSTICTSFMWIKKVNNVPILNILTGYIGHTSTYLFIINNKKSVISTLLTPPHIVEKDSSSKVIRDIYVAKGNLYLSRSLGNVHLEKTSDLKHTPEITNFHTRLKQDDHAFLIVAPYKFFEIISIEQIGNILIENKNQLPDIISNALLDFAFTNDKSQNYNMTVVVIPAPVSQTHEYSTKNIICEDTAVAVAQGNGKKSTKAAHTATHFIFNILQNKVNDLIVLSEYGRRVVCNDFLKQFRLDLVQKSQRERKMVELLEISIPSHTLKLVTDTPEFSNHLVLSLPLKNNAREDLLNSVERLLGIHQISHATYYKYTQKEKIIAIPLKSDLNDLPLSFDDFVEKFKSLLKEYVPISDENKNNLELPIEYESKIHPIAPAVKQIMENFNLTLKNTGKFDNKYFPMIDPNEIQIMNIEEISTDLSTEEKKNSQITMNNHSQTLNKPKYKLSITYPYVLQIKEKFFYRRYNISYITFSQFSDIFLGLYKSKPVTIKKSDNPLKEQNNFGVADYLKRTLSPEESKYFLIPEGYFHFKNFPLDTFFIWSGVELGTLDRFLKTYYTNKSEKLPYELLLNFCYQIANGLRILHENGIWHGDLRIVNIFVRSNLQLQLSGFGLSIPSYNSTHGERIEDDEVISLQTVAEDSTFGNALGSIAPELLVNSGYASELGDIYSYGGVMRDLFNPPPHEKIFAGKSFTQVIGLVCMYGVRDSVPACPREIQTIIKSCWAHNPSDRPTAKQLCNTLRELLTEHKYSDVLKNNIEFAITPPHIYANRNIGDAMYHVINEDLPTDKKILALLEKHYLATPQACFFVKQTLHHDHLLKEYQALIKLSLDTKEFPIIIRENLEKHHDTQPLMAEVIYLLKSIGLTDNEYYQSIFQFPKEKQAIYDVLSYLNEKNKSLCIHENFILIIKNVSSLIKVLSTLKKSITLNQESFEDAILDRSVESLLPTNIIKESKHLLAFKPATTITPQDTDKKPSSAPFPLQKRG